VAALKSGHGMQQAVIEKTILPGLGMVAGGLNALKKRVDELAPK
jgi:hypothetical protein